MQDLVGLMLFILVAVVSFFSGAAYAYMKAFKISMHVTVNGEKVTIQRERELP